MPFWYIWICYSHFISALWNATNTYEAYEYFWGDGCVDQSAHSNAGDDVLCVETTFISQSCKKSAGLDVGSRTLHQIRLKPREKKARESGTTFNPAFYRGSREFDDLMDQAFNPAFYRGAWESEEVDKAWQGHIVVGSYRIKQDGTGSGVFARKRQKGMLESLEIV